MSKQGQIDAFEAFCKAVLKDKKEDPAGCYFEELIARRPFIIKNIQDDIMPLVGIYMTCRENEKEVAQVRAILHDAHAEIIELKHQINILQKYDVRELNKRRREIEEEEKVLQEEAEQIDKMLQENL